MSNRNSWLALAVFTIGLYGCSETPSERHQVYAAWCKLYQRNDITEEEWTILREHELLPDNLSRSAAASVANAQATANAAMILSGAALSARN